MKTCRSTLLAIKQVLTPSDFRLFCARICYLFIYNTFHLNLFYMYLLLLGVLFSFLVLPADYHLFYSNPHLNIPNGPVNLHNHHNNINQNINPNHNNNPNEPYPYDSKVGLLPNLFNYKSKFHPLLYLKDKFKNALFGQKNGPYTNQPGIILFCCVKLACLFALYVPVFLGNLNAHNWCR